MSGQHDDEPETDVSRRTFMKASGAVAGAGILGAGAASTATAADTEIPLELMNPRVQEAMQAWKRGYRGRADRTVGLTDSGADARHPAIGPWNGIQFQARDGNFEYTALDMGETEQQEVPDFSEDADEVATAAWADANVGAGALGLITTHGTEDDDDDPLVYDDADVGVAKNLRLVAVVDWEPSNPEGEEPMEAELRVLKDGDQIATTGGGLEVNEESRKEVVIDAADLEAGAEYGAEVVTWRGVASYEVTYTVEEATETRTEELPAKDDVGAGDVSSAIPDAGDLPQLVGWNVADSSWVDTERPRDENSHGTHVSGIMTDSGRATTPDPERSTFEDPNAVLIPGQVLTYTVEADAGTGVFGTGYGEAFEIVIQGPDGRQLNRSNGVSGTSEARLENNMVQTPVEEDGEYTVVFRAIEGEALPARVESIGVGAFKHHSETAGDVVDADEAVDGKAGGLSLHSGSAPGASLVATVGLGGALEAIAGDSEEDLELAEEYAETFNVRAVNMSWGFVGGVPLGTVAGVGDEGTLPALRNLAEAGVLPVGSAGNDATPVSGNAPPAAANETISTVATDDRDGIASYSSGGIGAVDDDSGEPYGKPDVTAPGGELNALDIAAMPGEPEDEGEFGDARTYAGKGGTSMSAPSVSGLAALVSEAMEENREERSEDTAESLQMPAPGACDREDTMRLKSVILSTASETAFTAAPYHASSAKAPVYTHGGRDPYEGYGRVNFGAAIDAVTRDLLPGAADLEADESTSGSLSEFVGLDVPRDPRAVAGYVTVRGGTLDVDLEFSHYGGGNSGMPKNDPHLDLFVYDLDEVDDLAGEPQIVASDQGETGSASVTVDVETGEPGEGANERTFMVVAKMVNVSGVVNGFDVQAHFDLDLEFEAGEIPLPAFDAAGDRDVDSTIVFGRQANRIDLTVEDLEDDAVIRDRFPEDWRVFERSSDGHVVDDGVIEFGSVDADDLEDGTAEFRYFVQSPDDVAASGNETYGPAIAAVEDADDYRNDEAEFAGEDDVLLLGVDV